LGSWFTSCRVHTRVHVCRSLLCPGGGAAPCGNRRPRA